MLTVSIIAATFSGNKGAEAMLTTTIRRIQDKHEQVEFKVFSYYPIDDKKLVSSPNIEIINSTPLHLIAIIFPFSLLGKALKLIGLKKFVNLLPLPVRSLAKSSVLIDLAGVSFIDGREIFLPFNILTLLPAQILDIPVVKFSQAMGPFQSTINRLVAKFSLNRCNAIFTRGATTANYLAELKLTHPKVMRADDVAFLYEFNDTIAALNKQKIDKTLKTLNLTKDVRAIIGICPSSVIAAKAIKEEWDYIGYLVDLIQKLIRNGHFVILFPNATREENCDKLRNNDIPIIRQVTKIVSEDPHLQTNLLQVDHDVDTSGIKQIIKACDIVAVSRFHAMIGALSLKIPTVVLGWSHKYLEVMTEFDQEDMVIDYKEVSLPNTVTKINQLLTERTERNVQIGDNLKDAQKRSYIQFKHINDLLSSQ